MTTIAQLVRPMVAGLQAVLAYEPPVRPDFSNVELADLPPLIAATIERGHDTARSIYQYLHERNCPHSGSFIQFILTSTKAGTGGTASGNGPG